jgi:hypothetical protein
MPAVRQEMVSPQTGDAENLSDLQDHVLEHAKEIRHEKGLMRKLTIIAIVAMFAAFSVPARAASKGKFYNLNTGEVTVFQYKNRWGMGHGPINATLAGGEQLQGEFSTVPASDSAWGAIYGLGVAAGVTPESGVKTAWSIYDSPYSMRVL